MAVIYVFPRYFHKTEAVQLFRKTYYLVPHYPAFSMCTESWCRRDVPPPPPRGGSEQVRAGSMNFEDPWCSPPKHLLSHLAARGKCLVFHVHSFLFILNLLIFLKNLHLVFRNRDLLIQSLLWRPCSGAGGLKVRANAWIPTWEAWPATKKPLLATR